MSSDIKHFKNFSIVNGDMKVTVNLKRFEKQFRDAQKWLDERVMEDMVPYMPQQTGALIDLTRQESGSLAGSGFVSAGTGVTARFLYEGKVMVDEVTGSPWARKDAVKVLTDRDLTYSNPKATPHWFDTAKKNHGAIWISGVKERAGGG